MNLTKAGLMATLILLSACKNKQGPIIAYKSKIINLGSLQFKKEYPGDIVISNKGDDPLELSDATADCSCTVTEIGKKKVAPGDSTHVHFKITPARDGYIQQSIYLNNNSVNENRVLFLIRANVKLEVANN